jgi:hypothetical protein
MCGIEKDSWASSYLALGGGSAALAVQFYHAAQAEIQQHFDKLGMKDPSASKFYIEVMQFFLNLIEQHHRRIQQGGSKSNGHGARRGYRARRT